MSLTYIAGLSGSGKSTLSKLLQEKGYAAYDADEGICKWFNNDTGEETEYPRDRADRSLGWQEQHTFKMSEEQIAAMASHSHTEPVFILGIAPNDLEIARLYFDKVLFLNISEDEMVRRVTTRTTNRYGHDSDQLEVIKKWYQPTVDKYKNYGAEFIDAQQSIEKVLEEVIQMTNH